MKDQARSVFPHEVATVWSWRHNKYFINKKNASIHFATGSGLLHRGRWVKNGCRRCCSVTEQPWVRGPEFKPQHYRNTKQNEAWCSNHGGNFTATLMTSSRTLLFCRGLDYCLFSHQKSLYRGQRPVRRLLNTDVHLGCYWIFLLNFSFCVTPMIVKEKEV